MPLAYKDEKQYLHQSHFQAFVYQIKYHENINRFLYFQNGRQS